MTSRRGLVLVARGGFGTVMRNVQEDYVVKCYHKQLDYQMVREVGLLRHIKHPNIVKLQEVQLSGRSDKLDVVMPYSGTSLTRWIVKTKRTQRLVYFMPIAIQLVTAIRFIHTHQIIHRDLKPDNVLVKFTESGPHVSLCDFGISKLMRNRRNSYQQSTLCYQPPELFMKNELYNNKVDIWALGCTLYEVVIGHVLFSGKDDIAVINDMIKRVPIPQNADKFDLQSLPGLHWERQTESYVLPSLGDGRGTVGLVTERLRPLLNRMLNWVPERRPAASAILVQLCDLEGVPVPVDPILEPYYYVRSRVIPEEFRSGYIKWLINECLDKSCCTRTFLLTMNLFDAAYDASMMTEQQETIVLAAALLLANKYYDISNIREDRYVQEDGGVRCTEEDLVRWQLRLLARLPMEQLLMVDIVNLIPPGQGRERGVSTADICKRRMMSYVKVLLDPKLLGADRTATHKLLMSYSAGKNN
jgi:serine/threonine protein kinase